MRAPGFCNVNQLFDANLLQAGKVEVLKGPATVVFGSNALHGIINVLTRSVSDTPNQMRFEAGSRDYYRASASGAFDSFAASAQTTRYGGYQDESGYQQRKATIRLDHDWQDWRVSGVLEGSDLDQSDWKDFALSLVNPNGSSFRVTTMTISSTLNPNRLRNFSDEI